MPPFVFHVRKLPDPTAYLALGTNRFRGGALSKASLMGASGIHAAIDDGLLDIPFRVLSFETVFFDNMGNAVPLASAGANFSERQREEFRRLSRNRRFYISHINTEPIIALTLLDCKNVFLMHPSIKHQIRTRYMMVLHHFTQNNTETAVVCIKFFNFHLKKF
jgi:hypothetical protein